MVKEMKHKRQLSLLVALALSAGGAAFFAGASTACAEDVTGVDRTIDTDVAASFPITYDRQSGAEITNASDNGKVSGNKLTLTNVDLQPQTGDLYINGGYTAGSGEATGNTLTIHRSSAWAYPGGTSYGSGGYSASGNATGNFVVLDDVHNNVAQAPIIIHGGYSGNGDATGNEVTFKGGIVGDIYGGRSAGTGVTTGNTVRLGDGANALTAGSQIGIVRGGNKADDTGNILIVNTNADVAGVENFQKIIFNINSDTLNRTNPMLEATGSGATTRNVDWRELTVNVAKYEAPVKTYEAERIVLMHNADGIEFERGGEDTYALGGGMKSVTTGNLEFDIVADNPAHAQDITGEFYQFKNHTGADYAETTNHPLAWAGRTKVGNTVENNVLTVTGDADEAAGGFVENLRLAADGTPLTTGDAKNNKVIVNTGAHVDNAYGSVVLTKGGSIEDSMAEIRGGTVGNVAGGALTHADATGTVKGAKVKISGGTIGGDVNGGRIVNATAKGAITGTEIEITGGSIGGDIVGSKNEGTGNVAETRLKIAGTSNITGDVYGNFAGGMAASATDAEITIAGGSMSKVTGNQARNSASDAKVNISSGTMGDVVGNDSISGNATKAELTVTGGNTGSVIGNQAASNASDAKITIAGGTISGDVIGNGAVMGDATDAQITITGGSITGDVYANRSADPTQKTTGGVVNLGTATDAFAATIGSAIHGGSNTNDLTGNTLNVNSRNAGAADVKNFETVNFDVANNVSRGDTMLTLTNNSGTVIDWQKLNLKNLDVITASATTDHIVTLIDSVNDVTFNNYDAVRAREAKVDGDYEYVLNTANETGASKKVDVTGYRFANNTEAAFSAGTAPEAWGGRTKLGNKVEKNVLTVTGGTAAEAAGGIVENKKAGTGTGGYDPTGDAEANKLLLKGGTVTNAYGADVRTEKGTAEGNTLTIEAGRVTGNAYAGKTVDGAAKSNIVEIKGGDISGAEIKGAEAGGNVEGSIVTISASPTSSAATAITGGHSRSGDATENVVNINADIKGSIHAAKAQNTSKNNHVNIADGVTVDGSVFGGSCVTAEGNTVTIGRGGVVTGDVIAGNATGTNRDNIINITGARVGGTITGGTGADATGNTLAVHYDPTHTSYAGDIDGIQKLQFHLYEGIASENPTLLNLGVTSKDIRNIDVGVGVHGTMPALRVNEVISLMKVGGNGTLTMNDPTENKIEGMQGISLGYEFNLTRRNTDELIATVTKAALNDKTKIFPETKIAEQTNINKGADLLTGAGLNAARKSAAGDNEEARKGYHLWAAMQHGGMTIDTGSYVELRGYNLAVGWAQEVQSASGTHLFTPFVEYGKSRYDSSLDDGTYGRGNVSYLGFGVLGRIQNNKGVWAEAAVHGGRSKSDYKGEIFTDSTSSFDGSNTYYAAHLGVGKEYKTNETDTLDAYLRYFWSYQKGGTADITTSGKISSVDTYDFDQMTSNRIRIGVNLTHKDSDKSEVYAGVAWEYELSGAAQATYQGYNTLSPSMRGGSCMLIGGYRFAPKDSRFSYNVSMTGWQGKREGYAWGAQMNWAF